MLLTVAAMATRTRKIKIGTAMLGRRAKWSSLGRGVTAQARSPLRVS